jgi:glycosyltransferase involved in cell wall biosynthesis
LNRQAVLALDASTSPRDRRGVVAVTPWFPNRPGEREGNYVYDSLHALSERGRSVSVLVARPYRPTRIRPAFAARESSSLDVRAFSEFRGVELVRHFSIPRNLAPRFSDWQLDQTLRPALEAQVEQYRAGIIHAHTESIAPAAITVARRTGAKVVVTLHGINIGKRYFDHPRRRERFSRALRDADRVILVGSPLWSHFAQLVDRTEHFRVVPNGFTARATKRRAPVLMDGRDLEFVSVSNLTEGKGVDLAIQALATLWRRGLRRWTYTIVGDGPQQPALRRMASSLGIADQLRFVGAVPHQVVFDYLSAADVFVLPSYREAFGIAYLEAMSAGLLAIGVHGQGPRDFVEDGISGLLVAPHSHEDLARCLADILMAPESYRTIAATGEARVRLEYTWARHAERLAQVYDELLDDGP